MQFLFDNKRFAVSALIEIGRTTVGTQEEAEGLARALVEARLVACTQVDGPLKAIYRWEGKVEESEEWGLSLKFPSDKATAIESYFAEHHPYDLPQWVRWSVDASEAYATWVVTETG